MAPQQKDRGREWEKLSPAIAVPKDQPAAPAAGPRQRLASPVNPAPGGAQGSVSADHFAGARRPRQAPHHSEDARFEEPEHDGNYEVPGWRSQLISEDQPVTMEPDSPAQATADLSWEGAGLRPLKEDMAAEAVNRPDDETTEIQTRSSARTRASARAAAVNDRPRALRLRQLLIGLAVPLVSLVLGIRAVATTSFLVLEYHRPGFPADHYGFSADDRMTYGSYGLNYVTNLAPETYLSSLTTQSGTALFRPSEVGHMTDVKHVLAYATLAAVIAFIAALLAGRTLSNRAPGAIRRALFTGALGTLVLMVVLGVLGALGWESFFTTVHEIFFPQGNWMFRASDTLIRLYPPQFWVDAALTSAAVTLLTLGLLLALTWPTAHRRMRESKRVEQLREIRRMLSS